MRWEMTMSQNDVEVAAPITTVPAAAAVVHERMAPPSVPVSRSNSVTWAIPAAIEALASSSANGAAVGIGVGVQLADGDLIAGPGPEDKWDATVRRNRRNSGTQQSDAKGVPISTRRGREARKRARKRARKAHPGSGVQPTHSGTAAAALEAASGKSWVKLMSKALYQRAHHHPPPTATTHHRHPLPPPLPPPSWVKLMSKALYPPCRPASRPRR